MSTDLPTSKTSLNIEWWPITRPIPYARNARLCPQSAIDKVAASISEFGWRQPLVVDEQGVVIAGHTRLLAARRLGQEQVPVVVATDLSPTQVKAYRLADNRSAEETSWDAELLPLELADLAEAGYELELTGFELDELAGYLGETPGCCDADELPAQVEPLTRPGELWQLGPHRLLCGDATSAADVRRVMDGRRAVLLASDPPYLVNYAGGSHPPSEGNGGLKQGKPTGATVERHWDEYVDAESSIAFYQGFLTVALEEALIANPAIYQFYASSRVELVLAAWRAAGLLPHQQLIWHKSRSVLTHSWFLWDYEPLLVGWVKGKPPERKPPPDAKAVWEVSSRIEDAPGQVHPTIKPVELIRRPILYHTRPGETIFEPFAGSGTALIAAEQTQRSCCALERSPAFCDLIIARWQRFTGHEAVRRG